MGTSHPPRHPLAEFDLLAEQYREQHRANVAITGEPPEYFAEYKVADLAKLVAARRQSCRGIFDFGCGIGNSIPFFRRWFAASQLRCGDVSERSMALARRRFPGAERFVAIGDGIPLADASQDVVFSACVFHHIPHPEHAYWLKELYRVTRPGGLLAIYEHNPLNPLTLHAVRTCPLDANARLIGAGQLARRAEEAGWREPGIAYKVFFPASLAVLRAAEPRLEWLPLGAQYRMTARRPE